MLFFQSLLQAFDGLWFNKDTKVVQWIVKKWKAFWTLRFNICIKNAIKKLFYNKYLTVDFAAERWGNIKLLHSTRIYENHIEWKNFDPLGHYDLTQIQRCPQLMTLSHIPLGHYGLTQIQRLTTLSDTKKSPLGHYGLTKIQSVSSG